MPTNVNQGGISTNDSVDGVFVFVDPRLVSRGREYLRNTFVFVFSILISIGQAEATTARGISISLRQSEATDAPITEQVELYKSSYALVIGNDAYNNGWPPLSNAVKDAELVALALEDAALAC